MRHITDRKGHVYGRLTVLRQTDRPAHRTCIGAWWLCQCECGREVPILGSELGSGHMKSCGCLRMETLRQNGLNRKLMADPKPGQPSKHPRWTDESIATLRRMRAAGASNAKIARALPHSEGAVARKIYDLSLDRKPNPVKYVELSAEQMAEMAEMIRRGDSDHHIRQVFGIGTTRMTMLRAELSPKPMEAPQMPIIADVQQADMLPFFMPAPDRPVEIPRARSSCSCAWLDDGPRPRTYVQCEAVVVPGRPYCAAHQAIAYVPTRPLVWRVAA